MLKNIFIYFFYTFSPEMGRIINDFSTRDTIAILTTVSTIEEVFVINFN